jgi:hypothetical protein
MKENVRNSVISVFSEITRENHHRLTTLEAQENAFEKEPGESQSEFDEDKTGFYNLQNEIFKSAITVIVFSATMLEAYIYDYASRNLTDSFVQNFLDKLDPVSKWVVIPKLITGKELPRDHRWFGLLKRLFQQRNSLAHYKSSSPPPKPEDAKAYFRKMVQKETEMVTTAREAIELIALLLDEIKDLDAEEYIWAYLNLATKSDNHFILQEEL